MFTHGVDLEIIVNGTKCFEYWHDHKAFIEGRKGHDYELHFKNNSHCRKKLVVSVDGLNVLTGDSTWDKAYVLDRFQRLVVPGWRLDDDNVAKFIFSTIGDSYNQQNKSGSARNIGVIGCKLFNEKPPREVYTSGSKIRNISASHDNYDYDPSFKMGLSRSSNRAKSGKNEFLGLVGSSSVSVPISASGSVGLHSLNLCATNGPVACAAPAVENSVGTGWGHTEKFSTQEVYYDFEPYLVGELAIYYDSLRGLQRRGIDTRISRFQNLPDPFPSQPRDGCPLPTGRRY